MKNWIHDRMTRIVGTDPSRMTYSKITAMEDNLLKALDMFDEQEKVLENFNDMVWFIFLELGV